MFKFRTSTTTLIALAMLTAPRLASGGSGAQEEARASYQVVVHASNPISEITRAQVAKIFMGSVRNWDEGRKVQPVDQSVISSVRRAFTEDALGQSILAIRNHWRKMIYAGEILPPPVRDSETEVLAFVAQNDGAIAYVSPTAGLPPNVKAVALTEEATDAPGSV